MPHNKPSLPQPGNPKHLQEPLPWHAPRTREDDPHARQRLRESMAGPNCRRAERNADFLQPHEARGVRLENDYLKAEKLLRKHGVERTIVASGSTRGPGTGCGLAKP